MPNFQININETEKDAYLRITEQYLQYLIAEIIAVLSRLHEKKKIKGADAVLVENFLQNADNNGYAEYRELVNALSPELLSIRPLKQLINKFKPIVAAYLKLTRDATMYAEVHFRENINPSKKIIKARRENGFVTFLRGVATVFGSLFTAFIGTKSIYRKMLGSHSVMGREYLQTIKDIQLHHQKKADHEVAKEQSSPVNDAKQQDIRIYNIVTGLGPAGLALTLQTCKSDSKNRPIIAFSKRSDYNRRQILRLSEQAAALLKNLLGDKLYNKLEIDQKFRMFDDDTSQPYALVQTFHLERALRTALQPYVASGRVEIIDLDKHPNQEIDKVDLNRQALVLKSNRTVNFNLLLAADGAGHPLANLLREQTGMQINYYAAQRPLLIETHLVANYKISPEDLPQYQQIIDSVNNKLKPDSSFKPETHPNFKKLREFGWTLGSLPEMRLFALYDNFYVGMEYPPAIKGDESKFIAWQKTVLSILVDNKQNEVIANLEVHKNKKKKQPAHNQFDVKLNEAAKCVYRLPKAFHSSHNGKRKAASLFLFGEALRTYHYQTASGAVNALRQVELFGEFLRSKQTRHDRYVYARAVDAIRSENRERVNNFALSREAREKRSGQALPRIDDEQSQMQASAVGNVKLNIQDLARQRKSTLFAYEEYLNQRINDAIMEDLCTPRDQFYEKLASGRPIVIAYKDKYRVTFYAVHIKPTMFDGKVSEYLITKVNSFAIPFVNGTSYNLKESPDLNVVRELLLHRFNQVTGSAPFKFAGVTKGQILVEDVSTFFRSIYTGKVQHAERSLIEFKAMLNRMRDKSRHPGIQAAESDPDLLASAVAKKPRV